MAVIDIIKEKAKGLNSSIIFPEGEDERIIQACSYCVKNKIIKPVLVGNEEIIRSNAKKLNVDLSGFDVVEPAKSPNLDKYAGLYSKMKKMGRDTARAIASSPLFYSALALKSGDAQGMVGGAVFTSGDFVSVSKDIVGLEKGISVPSSIFIMSVPNYEGGEGGSLIFSDASVNPNPTPEELADIAVSSGKTAKKLLDWKPRIAMLSFSTKGSADHKDVCKVKHALEKAKKKAEGMEIDGEFQADTALVESVAKRKIKGEIGPVAGKANILIFPDLDAANIAYKLTQRLAKADAYGPVLQGFLKPISDLSRGATVEDIIGTIAIISVLIKSEKR